MNPERRRFLKTAGFAAAAAGLPGIGSTSANQAADPIKPGTSPSLGSLKQIDAGALNVGYAEVGPSTGRPVILLHGWPYDIHTYETAAPLGAHQVCTYSRATRGNVDLTITLVQLER